MNTHTEMQSTYINYSSRSPSALVVETLPFSTLLFLGDYYSLLEVLAGHRTRRVFDSFGSTGLVAKLKEKLYILSCRKEIIFRSSL